MATSAGPLTGTRLKRYRMLEQIGAGGMGVMYSAQDERLQRDVAIKVLVSRFSTWERSWRRDLRRRRSATSFTAT